jgi:hypothetical protein
VTEAHSKRKSELPASQGRLPPGRLRYRGIKLARFEEREQIGDLPERQRIQQGASGWQAWMTY